MNGYIYLLHEFDCMDKDKKKKQNGKDRLLEAVHNVCILLKNEFQVIEPIHQK